MQYSNFAVIALSAVTAFAAPATLAKKPKTGGPATADVKIFPGPFTCANVATAPDASAGTPSTVTITEGECKTISFATAGAINAVLTHTPNTDALTCYLQTWSDANCNFAATNQQHGYPFDGLAVGNKIGCGNAPGQGQAAISILCD